MSNTPPLDDAVAQGSGYELLKSRLEQQAEQLKTATYALNNQRIAEFGQSEMSLLSRCRARTENNCVARDMVKVGDVLLFGYNVFIGLKQETQVADVFSLYRLNPEGEELEPVALTKSFLEDSRFVADFRELYSYYKQSQLVQLRVHQQKLLAAFQIGQRQDDLRVFRWQLQTDGSVQYIDNRGERDMVLPPSHDFEWQMCKREQHVQGKHPHVNILDTLFVETIGGDLTIKIENNTETGLGIYSEPVVDKTQSLIDAEFYYAALGSLILLKIRPYREPDYRYLIYNQRTQNVVRVDAIGQACVQLPEDHGVIFPGGYYLQSGEHKHFESVPPSMRFKRQVKSPNGEDVLYVFYDREQGLYGLFSYNLINKTLQTPILSNGYARFDDGYMVLFVAEGHEASRIHPMQVWKTPYVSEEHIAKQPSTQTPLGKIGNSELVRAISECLSMSRAIQEQVPNRLIYEDLLRSTQRVLDAYFWLREGGFQTITQSLQDIQSTTKLTIDEFDKVEAMRAQANKALQEAEQIQRSLLTDVASLRWHQIDDFISSLDRLRAQRGKWLSIRELRYINQKRVDELEQLVAQEYTQVAERTVKFLAAEDAFSAYKNRTQEIAQSVPNSKTVAQLQPLEKALEGISQGLDLLTELLGTLQVGDATLRTHILDSMGGVYAQINQVRSHLRQHKEALGVHELAAEFGAQFKLFGQSLNNALEQAENPEQCDEGQNRLLVQLEELEGRFGGQSTFLSDILEKREAVYEAFTARKQALLAQRQQRAQTLLSTGERLIASIQKRSLQFDDKEALLAYFAADALVLKLKDLIKQLASLDESVQADTLETQLKAAQEQAIRHLRDKQELSDGDGKTIKLGDYAFNINTQAMDLAMLLQNDKWHFALTGTDFSQAIEDVELDSLSQVWSQILPSENQDVYRAEYIVWQLIHAAEQAGASPNMRDWVSALDQPELLLSMVQTFIAPRYQEGYQKGIHDHDAVQLLKTILPMWRDASSLRIPPAARALAGLFWHSLDVSMRQQWAQQAHNALQLQKHLQHVGALVTLQQQLQQTILQFVKQMGGLPFAPLPVHGQHNPEAYALFYAAADFLIQDAGQNSERPQLSIAMQAHRLHQQFLSYLKQQNLTESLERACQRTPLAGCWQWVYAWIEGFAAQHCPSTNAVCMDATVLHLTQLEYRQIDCELSSVVVGLLGDHPRIKAGEMPVSWYDFVERQSLFSTQTHPAYMRLLQRKQVLLENKRQQLQLAQYQAKPLTSFVRNQLINDVYFPFIGANLAKQMGAAGAQRRTDLMGALLLISPPGYGKTTLMEYLANCLGLVFVRINCPVLGHSVTGIDPAQANNSAARQELEKLNLGLAMGNNVMLYLDDIQHTHPEFLQKFIALCDGTRRIEGVFAGQARTYDLRGKRFCMVMAGNPYTESGDLFKIPDMLANRADIYNLGDILGGKDAVFAQSYLENCLSSHPVLAPLAHREPEDFYKLLRAAQGDHSATQHLSYAYSATELQEILAILQRLGKVRDVLLKVNQAYIQSAAQADAYRTMPPFKLQGSYRNMSKLAPKISAVMQEAEIWQLIADHYQGEAQTLTTGAEENLLRLRLLMGQQTPEEQARWTAICERYSQQQQVGGDADPATQLALQLASMSTHMAHIRQSMQAQPAWTQDLSAIAQALQACGQALTHQTLPAEQVSEAISLLAESFNGAFVPVVSAMNHKIRLDHDIWDRVQAIGQKLQIQKTESAPVEALKPPAIVG